jgi:hypothetical protein
MPPLPLLLLVLADELLRTGAHYALSGAVATGLGETFPWGTLVINGNLSFPFNFEMINVAQFFTYNTVVMQMRYNKIQNLLIYPIGLFFLFLSRMKYALRGYCTPSTIASDDEEAQVQHAVGIVDAWSRALHAYEKTDGHSWNGLTVLELGPGGSLKTGELIISRGAVHYEAVDRYSNVGNVAGPVRLLVDPEFKVDVAVGSRQFDCIVSCAAFEHFDNIEDTIQRVGRIAKPGAIFCSIVDFQTHSRWIRDVDPNNIYRYPNWIYSVLAYSGMPNRNRPRQYLELLKKNGWQNIQFHVLNKVTPEYYQSTEKWLNRRFRSPSADMETLQGYFVATR